MIQHFSDLEIIARTLYGEARGEVNKAGVLALESICSVIWNRWQINPKRFNHTNFHVGMNVMLIYQPYYHLKYMTVCMRYVRR